MIAHEHIQRIRFRELLFVLFIAGIVSLLVFLSSLIFPHATTLIIAIILLVFGMNFVVYLTKKSLIAVFFFIFTALMTFVVDDFGVLGWDKVLVYLLAAVIFELVFLIVKLKVHSISLDMVMGSCLSMASIPLIGAFVLSPGLASSFPVALINMIILAFAVGLISSVVMVLVWNSVKSIKFIIKLETSLMDLSSKF